MEMHPTTIQLVEGLRLIAMMAASGFGGAVLWALIFHRNA